ncbi:MAG: Antitoxin VapB32 [Xylophilus sp.]|nr:MAG: Antitoxin VapB32 [Xylophilus sp.]
MMRILMKDRINRREGTPRRTPVTIDDALYARALAMASLGTDKADIFGEAVQTFVRIQAAKRLAAQGGAAPTCRTCRAGHQRLRHAARAAPANPGRHRPAAGGPAGAGLAGRFGAACRDGLH